MTALIPLLNNCLQEEREEKVLSRYFHNCFYSFLNKSWIYLARVETPKQIQDLCPGDMKQDNLVQEFPPSVHWGLLWPTGSHPANTCEMALPLYSLDCVSSLFILNIINCLLYFRHYGQLHNFKLKILWVFCISEW